MNIISFDELEYHWNICCHECQRLKDTSMFVDHSMDMSGVLNQGSVYSYEFRDILEITCEEFESVGKLLCKFIDSNFNEKATIVDISQTILVQYPKIVDAYVVFGRFNQEPLRNWRISKGKNGLDWWTAHNHSKHGGYTAFNECTLKNFVDAIGALIILNLYLVRSQVNIAYGVTDIRDICGGGLGEFSVGHYCGHPFHTKGEELLPDFVGNAEKI